jgi:hypothetical protein
MDASNTPADAEESPSQPAAPASGQGVRVERDLAGMIVVHVPGRDGPITNARVARCFPWSGPDRNISICNSEGREMVFLETLSELDPTSRRVVQEELNTRVFNPRIRRIIKMKHEFDVTSITAETDRGEVSFQIRSRDDVRVLSPTRALFRDVDGNTYEVPDLMALDHVSRKHLEQYF